MPRLSPAGNHSCAIVALGCLNTDEVSKNEEYLESNKDFLSDTCYSCGYRYGTDKNVRDDYSVNDFYDEVILPLKQPDGHTYNKVFDALIDEIIHVGIGDKMFTILLNQYQKVYKDSYWPSRLEARGFELVCSHKNNDGELCHFYLAKGLK